MGDAVYGEDRKVIYLIVVAGMVSKWTFGCHIVRMDMPLQNELGRGRYL